MSKKKFTVSAPIVAIASVEVWAEDKSEAAYIGEDVLRDGDTNRSIHVHHDFDIDSDEITVELSDEEEAAYDIAHHVALDHFGMEEPPDPSKITADHDQWQTMHDALHRSTDTDHAHEE